MAKRLLILTLAVFVSGAVAAQRVQLGVRAGIFSQDMELRLTDAVPNILTDARLGFHLAAVARIRLAAIGTGVAGMGFYLQPEIVYSQNSYRVKTSNSAPSARVRLQTIDVPVLASFKVSIVRIQAGPVFNAMNNSPSNSDNVELMWKKPMIGYALGVSVDIIGGLVVDGRFNGQFNELRNNLAVKDQSIDESVRGSLSSWAIGVSWLF